MEGLDMMEEKIYNKLEKLDEKLDTYMIGMENRVSKLEQKVDHQQGFIKIVLAAVISLVGSIAAYISKQVLG